MFAPNREFYPNCGMEIRILFDLRIPGSAERIHRERVAWREQSDIEALDEDHLVLIIRPAEGGPHVEKAEEERRRV